uniref:Uncharacterized protein n=1 Tax=Solanum tuberosum TaxID=4113 RepID=M1E0F8_SOLTU
MFLDPDPRHLIHGAWTPLRGVGPFVDHYFGVEFRVLLKDPCIEGKRARQGHYMENMSEKAEKVEEQQGWNSSKPFGESPSGPSARPKFQHASPWTRLTWRPDEWFGDAPNGLAMSISIA